MEVCAGGEAWVVVFVIGAETRFTVGTSGNCFCVVVLVGFAVMATLLVLAVPDEPVIPDVLVEPNVPVVPDVPVAPYVDVEPCVLVEPDVVVEPYVPVEPLIDVDPKVPVVLFVPVEPYVLVVPKVPVVPFEGTAMVPRPSVVFGNERTSLLVLRLVAEAPFVVVYPPLSPVR